MRLHKLKAGESQEEDGSIKILVILEVLGFYYGDWDDWDCDCDSWGDFDHFLEDFGENERFKILMFLNV